MAETAADADRPPDLVGFSEHFQKDFVPGSADVMTGGHPRPTSTAVSAANIESKRCHQKRTVSWLI